MCQGRPADPTDPGDAADLSIMGYLRAEAVFRPRRPIGSEGKICPRALGNQYFLKDCGRIAANAVNSNRAF